MTNCQKDPTCGVYFKRGLFKDIEMTFPCVKCANTKKIQRTQLQHLLNTVESIDIPVKQGRVPFRDFSPPLNFSNFHQHS